MPRLQHNPLFIILQRPLDRLKQAVRLCLIDSNIIADGEDDLANLLLGAIGVPFIVLVEADGDVD
ncbi:predicted protein [Plenodomus lingam JN3]|uniref:Predicted protein n=1 Tax=Leptosphaeria maculans (strain JN3 / isolate v23.1.3 / race Av1-4-5-6-7-8) TaxID=985895 RepID=E4ZVY7_LEPMJ|nr:predicted protein [Plenodomus lingam JN3]CBX95763.1 predicted protein [Plenodomus lingam JN3]